MYNSRVSEPFCEHFPYVFAEGNFLQFTVTGEIPHENFWSASTVDFFV